MIELPPGAVRNKDGSIDYHGYHFPGINTPIRSKAKGKKRAVLASKDGVVKLVHFGHSDYQHNYSKSAKQNYRARSAGIRDKNGNLTKDDPHSANYWARKILWSPRQKPRGDSYAYRRSLYKTLKDSGLHPGCHISATSAVVR